jgi:hypothetical protein
LDFYGESNANVFVHFLLPSPLTQKNGVLEDNNRPPLWFRTHAKLQVTFTSLPLSLLSALHISVFSSLLTCSITSFLSNPLPDGAAVLRTLLSSPENQLREISDLPAVKSAPLSSGRFLFGSGSQIRIS